MKLRSSLSPSATLSALLVSLLFLSQAHAATFTVTNRNDSGAGSLRESINMANAASGADTIVFASSTRGTLTLSSGEITISDDLTIEGPKSRSLTLSGGGTQRLFNIQSGQVTLRNLTLSHGYVSGTAGAAGSQKGGDAGGGAILNQGTLTLSGVVLSYNTAVAGKGGDGYFIEGSGTAPTGGQGGNARGGAILNAGTLTLDQTRFTANRAVGGGGGRGGGVRDYDHFVYHYGRGGRGGNAYGGAIYNGGTIISPPSSIFTSNQAIGGQGGESVDSSATLKGEAGQGSSNDVRDVMPVASPATISGIEDVTLTALLSATGDTLTYSLASGTLPSGLQLDAATGRITGVVSDPYESQGLTYHVTDGFRTSAPAPLKISITSAPPLVVVTTTKDVEDNSDGLTSLREAIAIANVKTETNTIQFQSGLQGTISLRGSPLFINARLKIVGPQDNALVLDGNQLQEVLFITSGEVNISNLTMQGAIESGISNGGYSVDRASTYEGGILSLTNCTISNNQASGMGGGLYNQGKLTLISCTLTGNSAQNEGGGLYNTAAGTVTIDSTTITNNVSNSTGGGLYNEGQLTLNNAIVAHNTAPSSGPDIQSPTTQGDYNLVQDPTGANLQGNHNITGQNPKLGPLRDNGGPTLTMAPLSGSPAIGNGKTTLKTDQRGLPRPFGGTYDIGAVEVQLAPTLSVGDIRVVEGDSGTRNALFTVSLSATSAQPVTVNYGTILGKGPNSATAGMDFEDVPLTPLTFAPGQTKKAFAVKIKGDRIDENDEQMFVQLTGAEGAPISDGTATCTIVDDDDAPTLFVKGGSTTEGNPGDATPNTLPFEVALSAPSGLPITVRLDTAPGQLFPASANDDYTPIHATLKFAPGEVSKTVAVRVRSDVLDEENERLALQLSSPVNATLGSTAVDGKLSVEGIIVDDDAAPTLSIDDVSLSEGNSGQKTATFTVALSAKSGREVSVDFATANGTAKSGSDFVGQSGSLTFAPGQTKQTIEIKVNGDSDVEADETFFVKLSRSVNATFAKAVGTGAILNDDKESSAPATEVSESAPNS